MGRHADPDGSAFWRSLGGAAARATGALAVAGIAVALIVWFSADDGPDPGLKLDQGTVAASPEPDAEAAAAPTAPPTQPPTTPAPTQAPTAPEAPSPIADAPPPAETTVQVLDGVGGTGAQARSAAQALRDLGYDVVVINPAGVDVSTTQVQFTEGHEPEARALTARDARFGGVSLAQALSDTVDLHVLVGQDWSG